MNINPQLILHTGMMGNIPNQNMNMNQVNNPMEQNNGMNININKMNSFVQNEPNINQGMNIMQQQMMSEFHKMVFQMGKNTFQINLRQLMKGKPDFTKIKENLSKIYGKKIYSLVDLIYNDIEGKITAQSQKPKL